MTIELHLHLAELTASEPDQLAFLVRPDQQLPGIAEFFRDAVRANAARAARS